MKFKWLFLFCFVVVDLVAQQDWEKGLSISDNSSFVYKTYYSVNLGGIFYPFSNNNLKDGFASDKLTKNAFSGRFLLGYELSKNLGIQYGVIRPASWFQYDNVNNIGYKRSVWINVWSLSLKNDFRLSDKTSAFAEFGWANVTRVGFDIGGEQIYSDAHFGSEIYGAGFQYHLNERKRYSLSAVYIPESKTHNQPNIFQVSLGMEYHVNPPRKTKKELKDYTQYFFPKNVIQVSYGTGAIGYGVNKFFSMNLKVGKAESIGVPVFWLGDSKAHHAFSVGYQQTVFRTKKLFSLDWGVSVTAFQTEATKSNVLAFSIFPEVRFFIWRHSDFDMYTNYSLIGPTYLTKSDLDGFDTGPKLTYQDKMGLGVFFGKKRDYNFELRIMHYSNGNIFTSNAGVAVPLQLTFGKSF